jgi:hypothetical protein
MQIAKPFRRGDVRFAKQMAHLWLKTLGFIEICVMMFTLAILARQLRSAEEVACV